MESKLQNERDMMKAVNLVCSEFGVKIVQPLLSDDFVNYAKTVPISEKITDENDLMRKHVIRKLALKIGVPEISANARKKALQYGSMIHKALIKSR
jgi:asparagine synthase (glutamine-hydrolysing)